MSVSIGTDRAHLSFRARRPAAEGWVLTLDPLVKLVEPARVFSGAGGTLFITLFGGKTLPLESIDHLLFAPLQIMQGSNFSRVAYLNECFGKEKGDPESIDWASIADQLRIVQEEVAELSEGIEIQCLEDVRDAVCDVLVTAYGVGHLLGQPVDEDMKAVDASNLSKLCKDETELEATLRHYREEVGIEVYTGGHEGALWVKSSFGQAGSDGKYYPCNKFLKCVGYFKPAFAPLTGEGVSK